MDATDATFDDVVLARSAEKPVVVDFWADWCGPCKMLGPVIERAVEERAGSVELAKVDVDANPVLAQRYGISGIPAVKAFRDGAVVAEFVGAQPPQAVAQFLDGLVDSSAENDAAAEEAESRLLEELQAAGFADHEIAPARQPLSYRLAPGTNRKALCPASKRGRGERSTTRRA